MCPLLGATGAWGQTTIMMAQGPASCSPRPGQQKQWPHNSLLAVGPLCNAHRPEVCQLDFAVYERCVSSRRNLSSSCTTPGAHTLLAHTTGGPVMSKILALKAWARHIPTTLASVARRLPQQQQPEKGNRHTITLDKNTSAVVAPHRDFQAHKTHMPPLLQAVSTRACCATN